MSEESENEEVAEEAGGEEETAKTRKLSGKVLVLYIALPALLVLGGGGYAAMTMLSSDEEEVVAEDAKVEKKAVFYDLPEILVNLSQHEKKAQFLKIKVSLEVSDKAVSHALQPVLPRILDTFQIYLRELRSDDIEGSAGVYRLKEELLRRVNLAIKPRKIDRVLFKEIIVQ